MKWIKYLNLRPETIKLLEENIGRTFDINQSKILYDPPPRIMEIKTKINKWNLIKSFCTMKKNKQGEKTTLRMGENNSKWNNWKGLISKIYKQLIQLNTRKKNNPIKKWGKDLNRYFSKKTYIWLTNTWKDAQHHSLFSSVQSFSRVRLFATPWIAACQASLSITNSQS